MKKKTWQRVLALSLALIFALGMLASCGKTEDVVEDGGDRGRTAAGTAWILADRR